MGGERRQFVRMDVRLAVSYAVAGSEERRTGWTRNLGGGGLALVVPEPLEPGTRLNLTFCLPKRPEPIAALGQVAWCDAAQNEAELGVRFVTIRPADQADLIFFVASRLGAT